MKITKKYRLLIRLFSCMLFFVFAAENGLHGQEIVITPASQLSEVDEDNEIVIIRNEKKYPTYINFVSKASGDICTSFDLKEKNPYAELNFPIKKLSWTPFIGYDVSNVSKTDLKSQLFPQISEDFHATYLSVNSLISNNIKDNIAICYTLNSHDALGSLSAAQSNIQVFNKSGLKIFQITLPYDCSPPEFTSNGKFLAFAYGIAETDNLERISEHGIMIYDLTHFKQIVQKIVPDDYYIDGVGIINNLVICEYWNQRQDCYYEVYDLEHHFVYKKKYLKESRNGYIRYKKNGIQYQTVNGNTQLDLFETTFKKELIK